MPNQNYFDIRGINTYTNPVQDDGVLVYSVNMVSFPLGAKTKRTGYSTYLGTPDSGTIQNLMNFSFNDGTSFYNYRKSGSVVYSSLQGTGAWTVTGNGTVDPSAYVGMGVLDNTMIMGDGIGSTRHTTSGTAFTNTTLAPISNSFIDYQNRIYAIGTASDYFYSTTNDATNWNTTGTSDSSSFKLPSAGKLMKTIKVADRAIAIKNSGKMFKWDGYSVVDMSTNYGPSSPNSIGEAEDYRFYLNQFGIYGFGGAKPQLLSNAIQRQFYNDNGTGIAGTAFPTIPATCHIYDYLASVGTFTDDFTGRAVTNGVIKYDYQKNEFLNWDLATKPTSWLSFKDANRNQTLIFGAANGQAFKFDNSTSDNGTAISSEMIFVFNFGAPAFEKKWNAWTGVFNPGCEAKVSMARSDTYSFASLKWVEAGNASSGVVRYKFPSGSNSKLLFVRIYESSTNSRFTFYGQNINADVHEHY